MLAPNNETVFVRDHSGIRQLKPLDDWTSLTLCGALSVDPRTLSELERAWWRYQPTVTLDDFLLDEQHPIEHPSGPWLIIDLACQRLVAGDGGELPDDCSTFTREEGSWTADNPALTINFPPHWQIICPTDWKDAWPTPGTPDEPLDVRGTLFGRALAASLAGGVLQVASSESLPTEYLAANDLYTRPKVTAEDRETANRWHEWTVRVHAAWLKTPRDDLGQRSPREFLRQDNHWIETELTRRELHWSHEGQAPRPLDRDTYAFRYGPIGIHEVVVYFALCRELLRKAWNTVLETPDVQLSTLTELLHDHGQKWLREGSMDDHPCPPATIIENERRRMPLLDDGSHLDCDCPLCRMEADGSMGPAFTHFDGYHLELEDEEGGEATFSPFDFGGASIAIDNDPDNDFDNDADGSADGDELDSEPEPNAEPEPSSRFESIWKNSYTSEESLREAGPTSILAVIALAARVAELIDDLKAADGNRSHIDGLNQAFDNYRSNITDPVLARVATDALIDVLEQVAARHESLTPKVADLQSHFHEHRRALIDKPGFTR